MLFVGLGPLRRLRGRERGAEVEPVCCAAGEGLVGVVMTGEETAGIGGVRVSSGMLQVVVVVNILEESSLDVVIVVA